MSNKDKDIRKEFGESYGASSLGGDLGLKGVRLSPSQYLGSRGVEGAFQALIEIVQNSVDESAELLAFFQRHGGDISKLKEFEIELTIFKDDRVIVRDTGRGVPADFSEKFGRPVVEAAFEEINVGGKGRGYVQDGQSAYLGNTIGTHGSGAACANATSDFFYVDTKVMKDNKHYRVEWEKAEKTKPLFLIGDANEEHGTTVEFRPSLEVFELYSEKHGEVKRFYDKKELQDILTEYAYNTQNIKFILNYEDENGTWDKIIIRSKEHQPVERLQPYVLKNVHSATIVNNELGYKMDIYIGLAKTRTYFLTCNMLRLNRGTHFTAVAEALNGVMTDVTTKVNEILKEKKSKRTVTEKIIINDLRIGNPINYVSMYLSLHMDYPEYTGQSKEELRVTRVKEPMRQDFTNLLQTSLIEFRQELVGRLVTLTVDAVEQQDVYERERELRKKREEKRKREQELLGKNDPSRIKGMSKEEQNLVRARNQNLKEVMLYLVEGETAKDALVAARDVNTEAIQAIIHRPPNVFIHSDEKLWKMEKFKELYTVLYGNKNGDYKGIVISTDNDPDGALIKSLIIAFIFKFFPHYLLRGKVFIFNAPMYSANKDDEWVFIYSQEERKKHYEETQGQWTYYSYKGLGSISTEVLKILMNDPKAFTVIDKDSIAEGMQDLFIFLTDKHFKKKFVMDRYGSNRIQAHFHNRKEILKYQEVEYDVNELDTQYTYEPDFSDVRKLTMMEKLIIEKNGNVDLSNIGIETQDNDLDEEEQSIIDDMIDDNFDMEE